MIYACKQHSNGYVWIFQDVQSTKDQLNFIVKADKGKYLGLVEFKDNPIPGSPGKRLRLLTIEDPKGDIVSETGLLDRPILYYISADSFYSVVDIFCKTEDS